MPRCNYLITGDAGFLGINPCRFLLARGHRVRTLGIAPFEYPERSQTEVLDIAEGEQQRVNDTFNVGAATFGTMRENFQAVLDRAGHQRHVVGLPAAPAAALLQILSALHLSPLYRWIYQTAAQDSFVSIQHIQDSLGFQPRYSNRDALLRNYGLVRDASGRDFVGDRRYAPGAL